MAAEIVPQGTAAIEPVASSIEMLMRAAKTPEAALQLLDLWERIQKREAEVAFNQAMARLQPKLPFITKRGKIAFTDKNGNKRDTPFARHEDIWAAIGKLLAEEGFSVSYDIEYVPEKSIKIYRGKLLHSMGHSTSAHMPLPDDTSGSKNAIQAVGSTNKYAMRYLLGMLVNLITVGEDNDGESFGFLTDQEFNNILNMLVETGIESNPQRKSKFLEYLGAKQISEIKHVDYGRAMNQLQTVLRRQREEGNPA